MLKIFCEYPYVVAKVVQSVDKRCFPAIQIYPMYLCKTETDAMDCMKILKAEQESFLEEFEIHVIKIVG